MRALGLDVGSKTIGLAVSDELGWTAQPLKTVRRAQWDRDMAEVREVMVERNITHLVVGLPLNMNGSEGPSAVEARKVGQALNAPGLEIIYWDERLTTVAASKSLIETNASRKKRKEVIDQVAASLILQGWLDSRTPQE